MEWPLREQKHPEASKRQEQRQTPFSPGVHTAEDIHGAISNDNLSSAKTHFSVSLDLPQGHGAVTSPNPKGLTVTHPSWQMGRLSATNLQTFQMVSLQNPPFQTWQIRVTAVGTRRGKKKKKALAIPLLFLPRSSMSASLMAHVLAAWNLIACEDIREAYGHNKYTYAYTCVYTHTPRYVSTNTHSGM